MNFINYVRTMDKRLRVMLISTALLSVVQVGLSNEDLSLFFKFLALFFVPTGLILTVAILASVRRNWREHSRLVLVGAINLLIVFGLLWTLLKP